MRRVYKRQALISEINITPFTDVILVLLIIFMIATPLISQSHINVKLPQAASKEPPESSKSPLQITINAEGVVYIESKVLTNAELRKKTKALVEKDSAVKVILSADQACRFQDVVSVMDALKESGVKSLNIATMK